LNRICLSFNNVIERNRLQSTDKPLAFTTVSTMHRLIHRAYLGQIGDRLGFSHVTSFYGTIMRMNVIADSAHDDMDSD